MIITKEWIKAHTTPAGSWNRKQIEALGLTYPPRKGWMKRLEGTEIGIAKQLLFEHHAKSPQSKPTYNDLQNTIRALQAEIIGLR